MTLTFLWQLEYINELFNIFKKKIKQTEQNKTRTEKKNELQKKNPFKFTTILYVRKGKINKEKRLFDWYKRKSISLLGNDTTVGFYQKEILLLRKQFFLYRY